eukprot:1107122-Rhodomonas_salina.2
MAALHRFQPMALCWSMARCADGLLLIGNGPGRKHNLLACNGHNSSNSAGGARGRAAVQGLPEVQLWLVDPDTGPAVLRPCDHRSASLLLLPLPSIPCLRSSPSSSFPPCLHCSPTSAAAVDC